jgi:hypothetical protein
VDAATAVRELVPAEDTFVDIHGGAHAGAPLLGVYTWPAQRAANAILVSVKLDMIPKQATIASARLFLHLLDADATTAPYRVTVHRVTKRNDLARATGFTCDGSQPWTPSTCCENNAPLAQADIAEASSEQEVDATPGYKSWDVTEIARAWQADRGTNFGLLLNADLSTSADRWRIFASLEHSDVALRPYLTFEY